MPSVATFTRIARESVLLKRSSTMMWGVIGAKCIGVLSLLLLARMYSEEAFGMLGLLQALVLMVTVVGSLTYQVAIGLPEEEDDAGALVVLAISLLFVVSLAAGVVIHASSDWLATTVGAPSLAPYLWLGPPLLFLLGLYDVLIYWGTRKKAIRHLAWSRITVASTVALSQIAAWSLGYAAGGLILGLVLGTAVSTAVLAGPLLLPYLRPWSTRLRPRRIAKVAHEYRQFPLFQGPASLLSSISSALIPLGLGFFFGPVVVGLFWMADRVCGYLSNFVRQSMQHIFLDRAAELSNAGGDLLRLFRRTTLGLLGLTIAPTLVLVLWGPPLFEFVLGSRWLESGSFARWLAVAWMFNLLSVPAVQLAAVLRVQQWTLAYSTALAGFRAAAVLAGGLSQDPLLVFVVYALGNMVCSLALAGRMQRRLSRGQPPG